MKKIKLNDRTLIAYQGRRKIGLVGVELGVAKGFFSQELLIAPPYKIDGPHGQNDKDYGLFKTLYSIDRWSDPNHNVFEYVKAEHKLSTFGNRSHVLRASFDEIADHFPKEFFDFIYIDGYAHTGQEDGGTMRQWWPKLRKGGVFAGHDYHPRWKETMLAVDAFFVGIDRRDDFNVTTELADLETLTFPSWWTVK